LELFNKIRERNSFRNILIIFLTAMRDDAAKKLVVSLEMII
jgi:hypothetical protein